MKSEAANQFKQKGLDAIVKWITQSQSYRCPNCSEVDAGLDVAPYLFRFPIAQVYQLESYLLKRE